MSDVTRVACPGCRALLRFEPEALESTATCVACECRFSIGIYVRIICPQCSLTSKMRDSCLGHRIRCTRCKHDFPSEEGIPPGGGGLLLVARKLDSDKAGLRETVQPFLGHAREKVDRNPLPPDPQVLQEAERRQAQAVLERDRMARQATSLKAVLVRLVGTSSDLSPDEIAAGLSESLEDPDAVDAVVHRIMENRDRSQHISQGIDATFDPALVKVGAGGDRRGGRSSEAHEAEDRVKTLEAKITLMSRSQQKADWNVAQLIEEFGKTERERLALETKAARLTHAVESAQSGEDEALRRLEDLARGFAKAELRQIDQSRSELSNSHRSELKVERQRTLQLERLVEGLKTEIETIRQAEALKTNAFLADRDTLRQQVQVLERLVEDSKSEIEFIRLAEAARQQSHLAELTTERERSTKLDQIIEGLNLEMTEVRKAHISTTRAIQTEIEQLQQRAERALLEAKQETQDEVARRQAETEASNALAEELRIEVAESESRYWTELAKVAARQAEREQCLIVLHKEKLMLTGELRQARKLDGKPLEAEPAAITHPSEAAPLQSRLDQTSSVQHPSKKTPRATAPREAPQPIDVLAGQVDPPDPHGSKARKNATSTGISP